jgi:osmoprotectant transport system substrate-binding protein
VLEDDKHAFPPYQACFVVGEMVLRKFPALQTALRGLSDTLDDKTMRKLNRRVDLDHVSVTRVAADFLAAVEQRTRLNEHASSL